MSAIFLALAGAQGQVQEICTVSPLPSACEKAGAACDAATRAVDAKVPTKWSLSCSVTTTDHPPTKKQLEELALPFDLPQNPAVKVCDAKMKAAAQPVPLDAPTLISHIGSSSYNLTASGNYIVIVAKSPVTSQPKGTVMPPAPRLTDLNATMKILLQQLPANSGPFAVELVMPHAAAFGSTLATQVSGISSVFTAKSTGKDRLTVSTVSGLPPSCDDWKAFLADLRELAWSFHPESFEARLTATDAVAMATALGAGAAPASPALAPAAPATPASPASPVAAASPALTITVTPTPAAGTKPASGSTTTGTTATTITVASAAPPSPAPAAASATPAAAAVAGPATPGVSIASIEPDLLILSDTSPGDDALVTEKKRIAAVLDLPRPEMSISAWVMQNSSTDPESVNQSSQRVRQEVRTYNDGLEATVIRGWNYLQGAMSHDGYFDQPFYKYLARRVIFDGKLSTGQENGSPSAQQIAHDFLNEDSATSDSILKGPREVLPVKGRARQDYLGACGQTEYCLGYTTLFHPIKPRLTDLMLALIAANNTVEELNCAVDFAEGAARPGAMDSDCVTGHAAPPYDPRALHACTDEGYRTPCDIWKELTSTRKHRQAVMPQDDPRVYSAADCEEQDYLGVLQSMLRRKDPAAPPTMFLNCFRRTTSILFAADETASVTQLGLMRAAVADFLFNYKMSQQYPHEFSPYDLTTSAQAMNSALRPMVDAFVRDVTAYQAVLKRRLGLQIEYINSHLTATSVFDKPRFFNNAIVTVNTIASSEASVDTTVESYLESLNPPTLSGLASALAGAPGGTAPTSTSTPTALNSLVGATRFNEAQLIAAGLGQFSSSHIHIGRELSVDVKPESLQGGNSAELQVTLKADDEAASGVYSSGGSGDAEVSRFGKSDTITRIRVDSLKLFEVSSFASQLLAPKKRFPLLPVPGLEMPYFGSVLSIPLRPAREFHVSMAVMSAVVIPTASDLAFSARFVSDRLLAPENAALDVTGDQTTPCFWPVDALDANTKERPPCRTRPMLSLRDFNGQPVHEFNRMLIHCLATRGKTATPSLIPIDDPFATNVCANLTFRDVLGDVR